MSDVLLADMQQVFDKVFLGPVKLTPNLSPDDVAEWDSMAHITLLMTLEKHFAIKFLTGEAVTARSIGQLADLIAAKLQSRG